MLNELLVEKVIQVIVNSPTSCGGSFFIVENCLAEKEKVLWKHTIKSIDIITPPKPKHNSTDENKGNTEQKQNEHRDGPLNSYDALMAKITELKSFVMEELYTINKHWLSLKRGFGGCGYGFNGFDGLGGLGGFSGFGGFDEFSVFGG